MPQYIQETLNINFLNLKGIVKDRKKSDSSAAHYEQYFKSTMACKWST